MILRAAVFSFVVVSVFGSQSASAYSDRVRNACKNDYMAHCNTHELGSESLRTCMRKVGSKLAPACVDALVASGEISPEEIAKRKAEMR